VRLAEPVRLAGPSVLARADLAALSGPVAGYRARWVG
jgi:hypothetical protein